MKILAHEHGLHRTLSARDRGTIPCPSRYRMDPERMHKCLLVWLSGGVSQAGYQVRKLHAKDRMVYGPNSDARPASSRPMALKHAATMHHAASMGRMA